MLISYFRKRPHLIILIFILLIGLFFRSYKIINRLNFDHDGDLSAWIVKDIVINHHPRLVGQLTTAPGIFIGPLYYYLIAPFYILTKMDPIGAVIPITIIGVLTVFSYYYVFSKLFNTKVGLISSFLYAVLLSGVQIDRRVVPSTPTNIWVIWYFYTIVSIARGNYSVLPILGILIGLIWHIHIALLPALIAIPAAVFVSNKLPTKKHMINFLLALFISSLPLIIFEARHNFQQTFSLLNNFSTKDQIATGLYKFQLVFEMITKNINKLLFMPQSFKSTNNVFFVPAILLSSLLLIKSKILSLKEIIPLYVWFLGVFIFFGFSSSPISEYYFYNIEVIFLTIATLFIYLLYKQSSLGKLLTLLLLGLILLKNSYYLITQDYYHKGYLDKKALVEYVTKNAKESDFPCIGVSYITTPGENVGFRYFFYLKNLHLVHPSLEIPVYNIIIPEELSKEQGKIKFAHIGLIPPKNIPTKEIIEKSCQIPNTNLNDPMFGYVE